MAYKDLIAALPPDFKIKVGDKELDIAGIQAELDNEFTPLNSRVTELTAREKQLQEERDAAIAATQIRDQPPRQEPVDPGAAMLEAMKKLVGEKSEYDYGDPYSAGLLKRVEAIVSGETGKLSTAQKTQLDQLNQGIVGLVAMTLTQQMNSDFARHKWPDGYDPSKAWADAIKQGYVNPVTKLPDLARFNDVVMTPVRSKEATDKARQEGIEEGRKQAAEEQRARQTGRGRLGLVPRPGGGSAGTGGNKGAANAPRSLSEAIDSIVVSDAEIAANTGLRAG